MEVKVPRDILKYEEKLFFGLTLRQFLFSLLAVGVAVGVYFLLNPLIGLEMTSWVCILAAIPFALLGFVSYNGMTADQFAKTWIRSEILFPKVLIYRGSNLYMDVMEQSRLDAALPRRRQTQKQTKNGRKNKSAQVRRKEKDFERRGRNIYKYRRKGRMK